MHKVILNWGEIAKNLQELSKDDSKIENLIDEKMLEIIKETHPHDYQYFVERYKDQLEKIKSRLKEKYIKEFHTRVSNLISPATN